MIRADGSFPAHIRLTADTINDEQIVELRNATIIEARDLTGVRRVLTSGRGSSVQGHLGPDCEICNSPVGCCCPKAAP